VNNNKIFHFVFFLLLIFAFFNSIIIGISYDEPFHFINGKLRAEYINSLGKFNDFNYSDNKFYPGVYDTLSFYLVNLIQFFFKNNYTYEIKHLINLFVSLFTLFGLYLFSKSYFNRRIAIFATLLLFINPFFFGHMSTNPKDIISCFSLVWIAYLLCKYCDEFEKSNYKNIILLGFFLGLGLGNRLAFLIIITPLFLITFIYLSEKYLSHKKNFDIKFLIHLLIIFTIATLITISTWPHLFNSGFSLFKEALLAAMNWQGGPSFGVLNQTIYATSDTPRYYLLHFLLFRIPIFILFLFLVGLILIATNQIFTKQEKKGRDKIHSILLVLFFPIFIAVMFKIKIYDGIRLFLFLLPLISIVAAFTLNFLVQKYKIKFIYKLQLFAILLFFIIFLVRFSTITPYQYSYNNFFNGKFSSTLYLYEHDYWGTSIKELVNEMKVAKKINYNNIKIGMCGVDIDGLRYFLNREFKNNSFNFVKLDNAEYIIMTNRIITDKKTGVNHRCYNYFKGEDIAFVERMGVKMSIFRKIN